MKASMGNLGIRFNDCVFGEPTPLARWTPPRCAGLYAVLVADANWAPKPFQALYFGEFGNNATLPLLSREGSKLTDLPCLEALFATEFPMPFSTTAQRWVLCNELIWAYNPRCRVQPGEPPQADLVRQLDELERRHQQETAKLRLLFASAHTYLAPQPQPRRRIGFVPLSQTED
jgi:hypothetical protein